LTRAQLQQFAAQQVYRFTGHAGDKLRELRISLDEVEAVISAGEVIESSLDEFGIDNYLVLGHRFNGDQIQVACKVVTGVLQINTVYFPDPEFWEADGKTRRK